MSSTKKFFKSSMVYFMGNVLTKIISFFLLPLYTTRISTDEYGYFNTSTNYLDILIAILCMEIWSVIMRFMFDYEGRRGKEKAITNGLVIFCVSLLGYCAVFAVLALALDLQYLLLIFIMGLCSMIQAIYTYTTRGLGYNAVFAVSGIVGSLVNSLTNVALILGFSMTVKSLYLAAIAGYVVQILMLERKVHLLRAIHPKLVRPRLLKRMLRFSLPLAANAVCACFLTNYNSIMVTNLLGLSENGVFSAAGKFAVALTLVSSCFSMAWQELFFSKGGEEDKGAFYTRAMSYYYRFLTLTLALLLPVVNVVFSFFIGPEYAGAFPLVPLYLISTGASIYSGFLGYIFSSDKRTNVVMVSTLAAAAVNVACLHLTIRWIGAQAASLALLLGFAACIVIRQAILKKETGAKFPFPFFLFSAVLLGVSGYVYFAFGRLVNFCYGLGAFALFCFLFRDLLKSLLQSGRAFLTRRKGGKKASGSRE